MPAEDCRSQRGSTRFGTRSFKSRRPIAWKCGQVLAKTLSMPLPTTSFSVIWRTPRKPTAARDTWQFSTICRFLIARGVVVLSATRHGTRRLPSVAKQTHSWPGVKIILLGVWRQCRQIPGTWLDKAAKLAPALTVKHERWQHVATHGETRGWQRHFRKRKQ